MRVLWLIILALMVGGNSSHDVDLGNPILGCSVAGRRKMFEEVTHDSDGGTHSKWGCDHQCATLVGQAADKCGVWHQVVVGFGQDQPPFNLSCVDFLSTVDVCQLKVPVEVQCSRERRVVNITGTRLAPSKGRRRLVSLASGMDQLARVNFTEIGLTGTLPSDWGRLPNLKSMRLFRNNLTGPLPADWHTLTQIEEIQLGRNQLNGTLPLEWGELSTIKVLDLSWNSLSGNLPGSWGKMGAVERVHLQRNALEGPLPAEWQMMRRLKFLVIEYNNFTSAIPDTWGAMGDLVWLDLSFNPLLNGQIPYGLLKVTQSEYGPMASDLRRLPQAFLPLVTHKPVKPFRVIMANSTGIQTPDAYKLHRYCQEGQKAQFTLYITEGDSDTFWCGKTWRPDLQLTIVWSTFGLALLGMGTYRGQQWAKGDTGGPSAGTSHLPRSFHQCLFVSQVFWEQHLRVPLKVALSVADLVSDVILAASMYPSWTFYVVLVGLFLPDLICSATLVVNIYPSLRRLAPVWASLPLVLLTFLGMAATLPAVITIFTVVNLLKGGSMVYLEGKWGEVNLDKVLDLLGGVTACTEDVVTVVFSSVGLYLMSISPLDAVVVRLYFPVWAFWISVPPSMIHMAVAFWQATGNVLDKGDLSWVPEAFKDLAYLHCRSDSGDKDVERQGEEPK